MLQSQLRAEVNVNVNFMKYVWIPGFPNNSKEQNEKQQAGTNGAYISCGAEF